MVKKKDFSVSRDKEDWLKYLKNPTDVYDKEIDSKNINYNRNKVKRLDLHGLSLEKANNATKEFIIKFYNEGYRKLIIVTGKGLRSKKYEDPYVSDKTSILKNSIPDYIYNDPDLSTIVDKISKAEQKDGGDGAIYVFLKKTIK